MAVRSPVYQPTASQQASAALHLERIDTWQYVRIAGARYVVLASARSSRTYWVRADAAACSCPWYTKTLTMCSHMLAVRTAHERQARPRPSYAALFPNCKTDGCTDIAETRDGYCDRCASDREWAAYVERKAEAVASA